MRCQHAKDLISLSLDVEMPEFERSRLVTHLADCPDCRRHQEVLEQGRELMQKGMAHVPENFEWKVQLGIQRALRQRAAEESAAPARSAFWRPLVGSTLAVAAAVVLVGSFFLLPESGSGPIETFGDTSAASRLASGESVEPDLSGAVRGSDLQVNMSDNRFGIRTVAGAVPLGESWPAGRSDASSPWGWSAAQSRSSSDGFVPWSSGGGAIPRLQLVIRGYRLPAATAAPTDSNQGSSSEDPMAPR